MAEFTFDDIKDEFIEDIRRKSIAPNQFRADTRINPSGCILSEHYTSDLTKIRDFVVYPDDTWVVSFPKCGTTWTQEMVWLLMNQLDYAKAKSSDITLRSPFIEMESIFDLVTDPETAFADTIALAERASRPRCIKSHLPPELLPKQLWTVKPKIVYVSRNPKDVVVSYYHHYRLWNGYTGSLQDFFRVFIADRVVYAPYWNHIKSFWSLRNEKNVLFNTYEEMKADLKTVIKRTAKFLEVAISEEEATQLSQHLSFKSMQGNDSVNYTAIGRKVKHTIDPELKFIRAGESGGWRKHLTPEMAAQMDEWTRKHLSGSELTEYPLTAHAQAE